MEISLRELVNKKKSQSKSGLMSAGILKFRIWGVLLLCMVFTTVMSFSAQGQNIPELMYFKFDQVSGGQVENLAPPSTRVGNQFATVHGGSISGTGQFGTAWVSSGTTPNYIETGWTNDVLTGSWTISMWINNISSSSGYLGFETNTTAGDNMRIWTTTGGITLRTTGATGGWSNPPSSAYFPYSTGPSVLTWVYDHVAGELRKYLNGSLHTTVSQGINIAIDIGSFDIGAYSNTTTNRVEAGGMIDEFRMYNRALTAAEIASTWNQNLQLSPTPPVDAGIWDIPAPVSPQTPGNHDVEVNLRSFGTNSLTSADIAWEVNGVVQTSFSWTGNLHTDSMEIVNIGSYNFPLGSHTIKAWSENPNNQADTLNWNDTAEVTIVVCNLLTGAYTIDATQTTGGTNFQTFADAVSILSNCGVSGPVNFTVAPGTYPEQIEIGVINGASATNTVTFDGVHQGSVVIAYGSTNSSARHTILLDGASNVNFRNLTVDATGGSHGWAIHMTNGCENIEITDNLIITDSTTTSAANHNGIVASGSNSSAISLGNNVNNLLIEGNTIKGGYYNISVHGQAGNVIQNFVVRNNNLHSAHYYGIRTRHAFNPIITDNYIHGRHSGNNNGRSIMIANLDNGFEITNNRILHPGRTGIYITTSEGTATYPGIIANNMIGGGFRMSSNLGGGIYVLGSGENIDIYYNSINQDFSGAHTVRIRSGATNINLMNNSFVYTGSGSGYALSVENASSIAVSDFNNYFSNGSNFVEYGTSYADLTAIQSATSFDANSQEGDPDYTSATDLTLTSDHLAFAGTPIPGVTDDIFGNPRNPVAPSIGAEEYAPYPINLFMQEILAPQESCNLTDNETIEVQFMNFGYDTLQQGTSIEVGYQVNFNPPVTETLILPHELGLGQSHKYTFSTPADFKASGVYNIKTWVTIAGDGDRSDDTIVGVIENIIIDQYPYSQDFQDWFVYQSNNSSCSPTGIAQLDAWRQEPWAGGVWNVNMESTPTPNTGPSTDFLLGHPGGVYLYTEVGSNCHNSTIGINTPCIDVAALTNPGLNFAYHMFGEDMGELHVDIVGDTGTHYSVWSMSGNQGNVWHHTAVDLGAYTTPGERFRIRFRSETGTGPRGNMAIDAIVLGELPEPMNLPDTIWGCGVVKINAGEPSFTYDWSTGGMSNIEAVTNSGTEDTVQNVIVKKYNEHGMMSIAEVVVVLEPGPYVNLGDDILECQEVAVVLDAGNPGMNYSWNTGAVSQTITVSESGQYIASAIHSNGCIDADTINVIIEHQPLAIITAESDTNSSLFHFSSDGSYGTSFLWDFGDGSGSTLQNPVHMYNRQGTFDVTLTVSTLCGTTTTSYLASNINVGVENQTNLEYFNIYPNPSSGILNIELSAYGDTDFRIDIVDIQGRVVWNRDLSNSGKYSDMVDLSNLAKGVYFVRLTSTEGSTTQKLVIQ